MIRETMNALLACVVTFALCAVAYPAAVYGLGHTLFPRQAEGSLIQRDGKVVGSGLIGQPFASDKYFQPRPSAAGSSGYAADAASGSNLGTKNPALRDRIVVDVAKQIVAHDNNADLKAKLDRLDALQADLKAKNEIKEKSPSDTDAIARLEEGMSTAKSDLTAAVVSLAKTIKMPVPADLVTASGSGLDPQISPEAAEYQAPRVAAARGLSLARVKALIGSNTEHSGAIIGAPPRVNVLQLNLSLDDETPGPTTSAADVPAAKSPEVPPSTKATDSKPKAADPATPAAPAPTALAARDDEAVARLASRIDKLQERLDAAPIAGLASDVRVLKARVAALADDRKYAAASARRLGDIELKLVNLARDVRADRTTFTQGVQAVRTEVDTLRESVQKATSPANAPKESPREVDLTPAVKLFRAKQYAEALAAFRLLAASHPEDARVWYFAALSHGLATGQWRGETEEMVNKGVERERAGVPATPAIDAALADLDKASGQEWLAFYRQRAAKR